MKKFLSIILFIAMLLTAVSCTKADGSANNELGANNSADTIESTPAENLPAVNNAPKHYEIELNMDNYRTYLSRTSSGGWSGVLRFAYYENVVAVYEVII